MPEMPSARTAAKRAAVVSACEAARSARQSSRYERQSLQRHRHAVTAAGDSVRAASARRFQQASANSPFLFPGRKPLRIAKQSNGARRANFGGAQAVVPATQFALPAPALPFGVGTVRLSGGTALEPFLLRATLRQQEEAAPQRAPNVPAVCDCPALRRTHSETHLLAAPKQTVRAGKPAAKRGMGDAWVPAPAGNPVCSLLGTGMPHARAQPEMPARKQPLPAPR